jgi:Spy/CpxP family protein refolding chaperone
MNRTKWLAMAMAAALSVGGLFVLKTQAAESVTPQRAGRGQWLEQAREKLGLTDEQVAQIKAQLQDEVETVKGLVTKLHDARTGLREAIQAAGATEASVRAAAAKVAAVEADLAVERLKLYGKINPILTADQREQVKQFQSRIDDFLDGAINRIGERLSTK